MTFLSSTVTPGSEQKHLAIYFLKAHPFDIQVLSFIDLPIRNFITYNEADVSIIAFNFRSVITVHEREFFKVVVSIYKMMVMVMDLKNALENKLD